MFLIASYPRSGNHLVRSCVEYVTGRPTLGCPGNPKDIPIHLNGFADAPEILSHVNGDAVAHKVHFVPELENLLRLHQISKFIFIKRNATEAILAHIASQNRRLSFKRLNRQIYKYTELESYYAGSELPKICINYQNLISQDADIYSAELDKLFQFLGPLVIPHYSDDLKANFGVFRLTIANPSKRAWAGKRSHGANYWRKNTTWSKRLLIKLLIWYNKFRFLLPGTK